MSRYHTFWPRFWAGFVDGLVLMPIAIIDNWFFDPERSGAVILGWAAVSYPAQWLYSVLMHARDGQTVGKKATAVRVMDVSEDRTPSLRQAFLRDIGQIVFSALAFIYLAYLVLNGSYATDGQVSTIPGTIIGIAAISWFLLEIVTMLTNEKRRALHDLIAGTVVVKD
jgi:uncharacterized RDD family membrane protein YckC